MSGHSKWSTIKRKKGKADAARGKVFTRLIRELTLAARNGGGDPAANPRLRTAIDNARANNMPNANIERAIKKGTGDIPGEMIEEITYEGYAAGGVALLIETVTDNRNRTTSEVRHILTKLGGRMGEVGSVAYLFSQKGLIEVEKKEGVSEDDLMMIALDAGAEDVSDEGDSWEITTEPSAMAGVADALKEAGITPENAEVVRLPANTVPLDREAAGKVLRLVETLEDNDDVHRVSANFDIPDEILEELSS